MYSEWDMADANRRIRKCWLALAIAVATLLAMYVAGLALRLKGLVYVPGVLLVASVTFICAFYLLPELRYRRFLVDMGQGLTRDMEARVLSIDADAALQDGVRVHPVHILLAEPEDERIVYLNTSKRDRFPGVGATVRLHLYGRHIVNCERIGEGGDP